MKPPLPPLFAVVTSYGSNGHRVYDFASDALAAEIFAAQRENARLYFNGSPWMPARHTSRCIYLPTMQQFASVADVRPVKLARGAAR